MPSFDTKLDFKEKEQVADFVAVEFTHVAEIAAEVLGARTLTQLSLAGDWSSP